MCPVGFSNSTGIGCTAVNECAGPVNPCLPGTCTDLIGSYQCNCLTGYQFINGGCADINECAISQPCGPHGQCLNEPGTYSCRCDIGFEFSSGTCISKSRVTFQKNYRKLSLLLEAETSKQIDISKRLRRPFSYVNYFHLQTLTNVQ